MEKKRKILESREKFDKSLISPDLMRQESIKSLVEKQLLRSTFSGSRGELERVVQKRALEVSNFLEMLRSASGHDKASLKSNASPQNDWKLKQESDQVRVMYREGPEGTPFHTLLAEGYVNGPVDSCLCVSWESTLYKNWWPQYNIPTFKIIFSSSLQKIRVGEEISLVRVKPPWPVSEREAILHNFEVEFFEEDLVLVLLNTIPTTEHFDMSTHGFTKDGIPEAKDTVRIDVVGGYALQKVSPNRSYFRAIANMDIKLEFVPPALINFISRQLLANGHKLYQKAVVAVAAGDEEYRKALKGPTYARIREFLYSSSKPKSVTENFRDENSSVQEQVTEEILHDFLPVNKVGDASTVEIEEEQVAQNPFSMGNQHISGSTILLDEKDHSRKDGAYISPEVEHALEILDKAIVIFCDLQSSERSSKVSRPSMELEESYMVQEADCLTNEDSQEKAEGSFSASDVEGSQVIEYVRQNGVLVDSAVSTNAGHGKESPHPTKEDKGGEEEQSPSEKQPSVLERMSKVFDEVGISANGTHHGSYVHDRSNLLKHKKKKKHNNCCISFLRK